MKTYYDGIIEGIKRSIDILVEYSLEENPEYIKRLKALLNTKVEAYEKNKTLISENVINDYFNDKEIN